MSAQAMTSAMSATLCHTRIGHGVFSASFRIGRSPGFRCPRSPWLRGPRGRSAPALPRFSRSCFPDRCRRRCTSSLRRLGRDRSRKSPPGSELPPEQDVGRPQQEPRVIAAAGVNRLAGVEVLVQHEVPGSPRHGRNRRSPAAAAPPRQPPADSPRRNDIHRTPATVRRPAAPPRSNVSRPPRRPAKSQPKAEARRTLIPSAAGNEPFVVPPLGGFPAAFRLKAGLQAPPTSSRAEYSGTTPTPAAQNPRFDGRRAGRHGQRGRSALVLPRLGQGRAGPSRGPARSAAWRHSETG